MVSPSDGDDTNAINLGQLSLGIDIETILQIAEAANNIQISQIDSKLRQISTLTLLSIFALGNLSTLSLFFLVGFEKAKLTDISMTSLAAATIAEVAGLLIVVLRGLFANDGSSQ